MRLSGTKKNRAAACTAKFVHAMDCILWRITCDR